MRAIVITGAGRGFCAGADISRLCRLSAGETPRAIVGPNASKPGNFEQKFSYLLDVGWGRKIRKRTPMSRGIKLMIGKVDLSHRVRT